MSAAVTCAHGERVAFSNMTQQRTSASKPHQENILLPMLLTSATCGVAFMSIRKKELCVCLCVYVCMS